MKATKTNSHLPIAADRLAGLTDEELLLEYRSTGDRELFAQLVKRYERELFSYLRRYLGDAEVAEDAFQAAFLQVHLKCKHYEAGRAVRPWLYTIATNQAIDAQRRNRRHRLVSLDRAATTDGDETGKLLDLLVSHEASPPSQFSAMERQAWLGKAVDKLPDGLRDVVNLVYFQEMKYREAAEVLGIPVGTVKSRLHAAVAKLNECWNQTHPDSL
ncbi:MAG TPA: sigma-70 family RNA polymerase sigma factor [Pirellulaceae bacterium]|nr:sigma-70 family RNA polymerase sigma factor [Pirellulaceae bacterium]